MELKNMFLKANLDKELRNGKGPFFHWLLRVESPLSFPLL